jgi:hypothetical protein
VSMPTPNSATASMKAVLSGLRRAGVVLPCATLVA